MQEYVQYRIGKQYDRGWGTEQDHVEAAEWFRESDTGYARYALGNLYFEGKGVEQNYAKAFGLFQSVDVYKRQVSDGVFNAAWETRGKHLQLGNTE